MDRYAFDTMKNGYNRYQVEDYIQTQKEGCLYGELCRGQYAA